MNGYDAYEHRPAERVGLTNPVAYIRPCACGGQVIAMRLAEDEIIRAISEHSMSPLHQAWRVLREVGDTE